MNPFKHSEKDNFPRFSDAFNFASNTSVDLADGVSGAFILFFILYLNCTEIYGDVFNDHDLTIDTLGQIIYSYRYLKQYIYFVVDDELPICTRLLNYNSQFKNDVLYVSFTKF